MPGFTDAWLRPYPEVRQIWYTYTARNGGGYTVLPQEAGGLYAPGEKYPVKSASYLMMFGLNADKISAEMHGPGGYYTLSSPGGGSQFRRWPEGFDYDHFMKLRHADGY